MDPIGVIQRIVNNMTEQLEGVITSLPVQRDSIRRRGAFQRAEKGGRAEQPSAGEFDEDTSCGSAPPASPAAPAARPAPAAAPARPQAQERAEESVCAPAAAEQKLRPCGRCGKPKLNTDFSELAQHALVFPLPGIRCLPRESDRFFEEVRKGTLLLMRDVTAEEARRFRHAKQRKRAGSTAGPGPGPAAGPGHDAGQSTNSSLPDSPARPGASLLTIYGKAF